MTSAIDYKPSQKSHCDCTYRQNISYAYSYARNQILIFSADTKISLFLNDINICVVLQAW